jgi:hypothetical protein
VRIGVCGILWDCRAFAEFKGFNTACTEELRRKSDTEGRFTAETQWSQRKAKSTARSGCATMGSRKSDGYI